MARRCRGMLRQCVNLAELDQDFIETLMVSCYAQGMEDTLGLQERKEGTYEEER